jgi:hypothetical protein
VSSCPKSIVQMQELKNPFHYKCVNTTLKLYKIFGPGILKSPKVFYCDELSAKECVEEYFWIYILGYKAGKKARS